MLYTARFTAGAAQASEPLLLDSIGANVFFGRELMRRALGILPTLDRKAMAAAAAKETVARLDFHVDRLDSPVGRFSGGQRQAAIGRAICWNARVILMDEPTAALGVPERRKVLALIRGLKSQGRGVIFISHSLQDIFAVSDRVVVLRRGSVAGERRTLDTSHDEVVKLMIGG